MIPSGWSVALAVCALVFAPMLRAADTTPPVITPNGANPAAIYVGSGYLEPGATAVDDVDGPVMATPSGTVDANTVGSYTITYTAKDAANNTAAATRTVNVFSTPVWAQNFHLPGVAGTVRAIAETSNAFYCGGSFSYVGSVAAKNIVRVDKATGAVTPLGSATQNGTDSRVEALAVVGTDLYVGGQFLTVSDSTQLNAGFQYIAKWSMSGNVWTPLGDATQNGTDGNVNALALVGTDLYLGGSFSVVRDGTLGSFSAKRIAKWSTSGSGWNRLGSATQNGTDLTVRALAVVGSDLYVGGEFFTVSDSTQLNAPASRIAKWSTSGSVWTPLGSAGQNGADSYVYALAMVGSDLYVGGDFSTVSDSTQSGMSANRIAKWSTSGSVWTRLGSAAQKGTNGRVNALAAHGADLYVGGNFTTVSDSTQSGASANRVAKWSTSGNTWTRLGSVAQNGTSGQVHALAVSGADLYAGGAFPAVSSSTQNAASLSGAAKWSTTASTWSPVGRISGEGDGIDGSVKAVLDAGAVVYVGGSFTRVGNVAANNVACWNKATRTWSALGGAAQNGTNNPVYALAVIGTDIYVGGIFSSVSDSAQLNVSARGIAKWSTSGNVWAPLGSATQNGVFASVYALAVMGTDLYVGGQFTTVSDSTQLNTSARRVAKWSTSQSVWTPLGSATQNGAGNTVHALAVVGTDLYVGGSFTTVSDSTQLDASAKCVAKWSTSESGWTPLGSATQNGTIGQVSALAVVGTDLYAGGSFISFSDGTQLNVTANNLAKWNTSGSVWTRLGTAAQNGASSSVNALAVVGADLYVGGAFTRVSDGTQLNATANYLAMWNPGGSVWTPLGSAAQNGTSYIVSALAAIGKELYVGGDFATVRGSNQSLVASENLGVYSPTAGMDISVEQPSNSALSDGTSNISFGTVTEGAAGIPISFTIRNPGTTALALGAITMNGTNGSEFTASAPASTTVLPGESSTFNVTFHPATGGPKTAALHVASNAGGAKASFDLNLTGTGNAKPVLTLPASTVLAEADATTGSAVVNFNVSAMDAEDGALTPTAMPPSGSSFPLGDTWVNVSATDSTGATTTGTFVVRVAPTAPPVITLLQSETMSVFVGGNFLDPGAVASDSVSGNATVSASGTVNANEPGTYTITYTATDTAGNTATATRTVNVVTSPVWAENFGIPGGVNGRVNAIAETADAFYYGGDFTHAGVISANNLMRVDKVTGVASPLGSPAQNGTNGQVMALVVNGTDLYVGGYFTTASSSTQSSISANRVAKWSTTTGTWEPLGGSDSAQNGANSYIWALAMSGTDLYAGGAFTTVSSSAQSVISANRVAKWSTTVGTWAPLGESSPAQNGTDSQVNALAVSGTDLYVGGTFTTVSSSTQSSIPANRVAKWSATASAWAPLGGSPSAQNGTDGEVDALAVSGADLYVGGAFITVSSGTQSAISANRVAKWSTTTATWSPLGGSGPTQNGTERQVNALAVRGTNVYVGGAFFAASSSTQYPISTNKVARWSTTAGTWSPLGGSSPAQNGTDGLVYALAVNGTDLRVGGGFTTVGSSTQSNAAMVGAARWSIGSSTWMAVVPWAYGDGINGTVNAVVDAGSVVYVGGSFTRTGNVPANNVACWTKATRTWSALGSPAQNGTNSTVYALAVSGTDLYAGGDFTTVSSSTQNSISANRVAKWSTSAGTWSPLGSATQNGLDGTSVRVNALAMSGTDLYAGGRFRSASSSTQYSISATCVAKWSATTGTWSPLGSAAQDGTNGEVNALVVSGADLYVGGTFTTVSSSTQSQISARNVAKWSTTANAWSPLGGSLSTQNGTMGISGTVRALAISGTDLYVGGSFSVVRSSTQSLLTADRVAKWSTTTKTWSPLGNPAQNGANLDVQALAVDGTDLYVGGTFSMVTQGIISANKVAKWSLAESTWSPLGSAAQNGADSTVLALAISGTDLYVGGAHDSVSSSSQPAVASTGLAIYGPISGMKISVEQPANTPLTDNASSIDFGNVTAETAGTPVTFTIRNPGTTALVLGTITVDGENGSEFAASAPASTTVLAGGSTTFTVTFNPTTGGAKMAALHVATNVSGAKSSFDLNLSGTGNAKPTLMLPSAPVVAEAAGPYGANVSFTVTASDAEDGQLSPDVSPASTSLFPLGDTTVSVSATDTAGATTSGSFTVTVRDSTRPMVAVPANITTSATSANGAIVSFNVIATDLVDGTLTATPDRASGSVFPIGTTTVRVSATDARGNTGMASFTVTVTASKTATPAATNDEVPGAGIVGSGVPAGATWRTFGVPGIDDGAPRNALGIPVYLGTFAVPTANPRKPLIVSGIFGLGGSHELLARAGDLAPGTDMATFASFGDPVGNQGTAFIGTVKDKNGKLVRTTANGIWSNAFPDADGALHLVARLGSAAADTGANYKAIDALTLNDGQHLFWTATLTGPLAANRALFLQSSRADGPHVVLQTGEAINGFAGVTVKSFIALREGGNGGLANVTAGFGTGRSNGGATTPVLVTFSDKSTAIFKVGLNDLDFIARTDAATPDIANGNWKILGLPAAAGATIAFRAVLKPAPNTTAVTRNNAVAIYVDGPNHPTAAIARQGGDAGDAQHQFLAFSDPAVNANGDVQFFAQITGPEGKTTALCLARNAAGTYTVHVLARLGGDAPEIPGVLLSKFTGAALPQNFDPAVAQYPVFLATLKSGTTKIKATDNTALFTFDSTGAPYLLVRTGLQPSGKMLRTISAFSAVLASPGQSRATASGSKVIYRATYSDKTQAIVEVPMR